MHVASATWFAILRETLQMITVYAPHAYPSPSQALVDGKLLAVTNV